MSSRAPNNPSEPSARDPSALRLLHLTRDFPPRSTGGLSTAVGGLVKASVAAGVYCAVISFDAWRPRRGAKPTGDAPPPVEGHGGATVFRVRGPHDLPAATAFAGAQAPTLIHVHDPMLWEFAAGLRPRLPTVLSLHVLHIMQNRVRGFEDIGKTTLSLTAQTEATLHCTALHTPSEATRRAAAAWMPRRADAIVTIPLGVAPPSQRPDGADGHGDGHGHDGCEAALPNQVTYFGRFDVVKGTHDLLAAWSQVVAWRPSARLRLVGGVPENPKAARRWQRRWRQQTPQAVQDTVDWAGWLRGADLEDAWQRAAIVVVPSRWETFGQTAMEALMRGKRLVATPCGAMAQWPADPGVTSTPAGDPDALARALINALMGDDLMADDLMADALMGDALMGDLAEKELPPGTEPDTKPATWDQVISQFIDLYEDAIRPHSHRFSSDSKEA